MESQPRPRTRFRACLVGLYLFSVPSFSYSESMGLKMVPQIIGVFVVGLALLDLLRNLKIEIPKEIGIYGAGGLWALATFAFSFSAGEVETLRLGSFIKVVVATLACAQLVKDEDDMRTALEIFVFSIFLVYYLNREQIRFLTTADVIIERDRFAGTISNANFAANFALTVIWASVFLLLHSAAKGLRMALFMAPIGISLLIIYYSGSKKGLVGIALYVVLFARLLYIRQRTAVRKSLTIVLSGALVLLTGFFIYSSPFFFRMQQLYYGGGRGDANRFTLAGDAFDVWLMNIKTFVMGVGYDNFKFFGRLKGSAHSTPLELLADNGIIGLALFTVFLVLMFRTFSRLYQWADNLKEKSIYFSCLIFLFLFSLFMLAEPLQDSRELLPILGILAAFGQYQVRRHDLPEAPG